MKFADFIQADAIRVDLKATTKEPAVRELVAALVQAGQIRREDEAAIVQAIMVREELGSTGIGRGIAVPHTKHMSVDRLVGTVGVSTEGVEFKSLDGDKVYLFFLLISPLDRPGDHLRALESVSRQLQDDDFCQQLRQARRPADVQQLLDSADSNQFVS